LEAGGSETTGVGTDTIIGTGLTGLIITGPTTILVITVILVTIVTLDTLPDIVAREVTTETDIRYVEQNLPHYQLRSRFQEEILQLSSSLVPTGAEPKVTPAELFRTVRQEETQVQ